MKIPFSKMNGLGNRIIVADLRKSTHNITPQAILTLSSNPQTAFDQIMAIHLPIQEKGDFHIEIWNSDGSKAKTCGNGIRCVIEWLANNHLGNCFRLETPAGLIEGERQTNGLISVDMGLPNLKVEDMPLSRKIIDIDNVDITAGPLKEASLVSVGNLHAIFFVENNIQQIPLEKYGKQLEYDSLFLDRCNISVVHVMSKKSLAIRTWERGAGLTQACGSAACASTVAAYRRGLIERSVDANLPGGVLSIFYRDDGHIIMTGPTEHEFSGFLNPLTGTYKKDPLQWQ